VSTPKTTLFRKQHRLFQSSRSRALRFGSGVVLEFKQRGLFLPSRLKLLAPKFENVRPKIAFAVQKNELHTSMYPMSRARSA
jgi:hypothetical protein